MHTRRQRLNRSLPGPSRETRLPINNRLLSRRLLDEEIGFNHASIARGKKKGRKEERKEGRRCTRDARGPHLGSISHSNGLINRLTPPIRCQRRCNHRIRILPSLPFQPTRGARRNKSRTTLNLNGKQFSFASRDGYLSSYGERNFLCRFVVWNEWREM